MSMRAILTIAAVGMSLSAVPAYADRDGGDGNGEPFPYSAAAETTRVEPAPVATRAEVVQAPSLATTNVVRESSKPIAAAHAPVVRHRTHAAATKPVPSGYEETDVAAADILRLGR